MNYYQVLGVPEKASDKEIKKAYKKLVKKYHPDIFHGDKEFAENKIKEINEAYETLSDSMLKAEYDEALNNETSTTPFDPTKRSSQAQDNYNYNSRYRDNDFYNSDSYRNYSYRYYGRSHSSQEFEEYKKSQQKVKDTDGFFSASKAKIILFVGITSIILIIVLIVLLNVLKEITSPNNMFNDLSTSNNSESVLVIEKGLTYEQVRQYYGEPDEIEYASDGYYAIYGNSYIYFDKRNTVKDWINNGDFVTTYQRGQQEVIYNDIYNELQNAMYFD